MRSFLLLVVWNEKEKPPKSAAQQGGQMLSGVPAHGTMR
jgi:hypothetical protein